VFITARGTVGKLALASQDMAMNQSCYALRGRNRYGQIYLFFATQHAVYELKTRAHGAVFDTIILDTFKLLEIVKPPLEIADFYDNAVSPLLDLSLNLLKQNANLRTQRDLLLPKLISGEIDVSDVTMSTDKAAAE
jgi:type I restriction enzyme S subunit